MAINPEVYRALSLTTLPFSGRPQLPAEALRFGFVGAYWFILQDLIRRYFRDDLKTSAYVSVSARIIVVVVLVATMSLLPMEPQEQAVLAFLVGVFPQLGVQMLKTGVGKLGKRMLQNLERRYPLADLDGLSVWDEARLAEEGIEDLQGLTTANLVDVLLYPRPSHGWSTGSIRRSCISVSPTAKPEADPPAAARPRHPGSEDLDGSGQCPATTRHCGARSPSADGGPADTAAVEALLRTFDGDVNLAHVRVFRHFDWLDDDVVEAAEWHDAEPDATAA